MAEPEITGYAPVNGLDVYWERRGSGGTPLIVVHGGFGVTSMFSDLLDALAVNRQVIAIELQGHGHTGDIDRDITFEALGDDVAGVIEHLGLGKADLVGYSFGASSCLRTAIQHPGLVRRLVVVSIPFRREGWFVEVRGGMDRFGSGLFDQMSQSPMYAAWSAVAPDREAFPAIMDKVGAVLRRPYDWSAEVRALEVPTMLVYGDADSIPPSHAAEFFALLGGGLRDADWDGSGRSRHRLAVLPGRTHYDSFAAPELPRFVEGFLNAEDEPGRSRRTRFRRF